jgi:2-dehydro-3-deoxygalactonokinase
LDWHGPFIAVDWGTTNRRAWRIGVDGTVEDSLSDGAGIAAVRAGDFDADAATLRDRLGDLPMLLGGMIGSDRGWRNVPYIPCPADPCSFVPGIVWIDPRTGILPGVSQPDPDAPEVMRGEEVQIMGSLAHRTIPPDAVVCCPGTHSKWVRIEAGRIVRFATWMTGELFALLCRHSILAPLLADKVEPGADFMAGVTASGDGDALGQMFALRAAALLGLPHADGASYASGLLIGAEVRAALTRFGGQAPWLIGRADLCALYVAATAQVRGGDQRQGVIDGEAAFRAGTSAIVAELR